MLLLDAGNSRLKWAWAEDAAWRDRGLLDIGQIESLGQALAHLPAPPRILAANVAGPVVAKQIEAACARWETKVEFVRAAPAQCGVRNAYRRAEQLGSDRWAALIAAWERQHAACLVVNCGTATTVDALSAAGEFRGGLILPGLAMMRRSLAAGTAQLDAAPGIWEDFPRSTENAVYSGAIQATVGAIVQQHALLREPGAVCLLDGGAAGEVAPHLGVPVARVEDLVLRGLQLISRETGGNLDS